mgnify:FL=1|jgi:hypothetical protein
MHFYSIIYLVLAQKIILQLAGSLQLIPRLHQSIILVHKSDNTQGSGGEILLQRINSRASRPRM